MRRTGDFEQRRGLPPSQGGGACIGLRGAPLAFFASSYKAAFFGGLFEHVTNGGEGGILAYSNTALDGGYSR
jgi:hypothetical protein